LLNAPFSNRIKKPKTHRYPSLKGTDPKFRRNHKHALHGTMKALVRTTYQEIRERHLTEKHMLIPLGNAEGGEGGEERRGIKGEVTWGDEIPERLRYVIAERNCKEFCL